MANSSTRTTPSLAITGLWLGLAVPGAAGPARAQEAADALPPVVEPVPPLELLYHADMDGRLAEPDCQGGRASAGQSYAGLLTLLRQARTQASTNGTAPPVVLLGGNLAAPDLLGRALLERGSEGVAKLAQLFARGSYDGIALGHHDLSLAPSVRQALVDAMASRGLHVLVSNLRCEPEQASLCERTRRQVLLRRAQETVGILATISPSVLAGIAAESRAGLHLDDPLTTIRRATQELRAKGATYVVLMVQGPRDQRGLEELDALQRGLAPAEPLLAEDSQAAAPAQTPDVILVGGQTDDDGNRPLRLLRRQDAPPAVGSPTGATALSHVVLQRATADRGHIEVTVERIVTPNREAKGVDAPAPDAEAAALLAPEIAAYCRAYQTAISPAPVRGSMSRDDFVTYALEVMRRRAHAEIAILNRAAVKSLPFPMTGRITLGHLHSALPYQMVIGIARMTGASIASVLGSTLDNPKAAVVGLGQDAGQLRVNGRPLDKARNYRVATIAFVASGGDAIVNADALPWRPLPGSPDLRGSVEEFLKTQTGRQDNDPTVDPKTDFGPSPDHHLLLVGLMDGGMDIADTRIDNSQKYGDAQLTRGKQLMWKAEWTGILQARHPRHESDSRLNFKYGRTRNEPVGGPAASTETADLITFTSVYNYRGLRAHPAIPRPLVPDPYVRMGVESEFTRPTLSATQTRDYHHLELTSTVGALFTVVPSLKLRGGGGVRKELLTDSAPFGRWRAVLEAGASLAPTALATVGPLPIRVEGLADYSYADPTDLREHQLRASGKLSVPLLPLLFVTVGLDVFAVQRKEQGWAASYDTTIGLRVHLDSARQWL